jgi:hypothetical protein
MAQAIVSKQDVDVVMQAWDDMSLNYVPRPGIKYLVMMHHKKTGRKYYLPAACFLDGKSIKNNKDREYLENIVMRSYDEIPHSLNLREYQRVPRDLYNAWRPVRTLFVRYSQLMQDRNEKGDEKA